MNILGKAGLIGTMVIAAVAMAAPAAAHRCYDRHHRVQHCRAHRAAQAKTVEHRVVVRHTTRRLIVPGKTDDHGK